MTQIIQAIAMLCMIPNGYDYKVQQTLTSVHRRQLQCQQYYVKCVQSTGETSRSLSKCILDKEVHEQMKNYTMELTFKRTAKKCSWALFNQKGDQISPVFYEATQEKAFEQAKAWASSWNSVHITVEEDEVVH